MEPHVLNQANSPVTNDLQFDSLHAFDEIPDTKYTYVQGVFYRKGFHTKLYVRSDLRIYKHKIMRLEHHTIKGFVKVQEIQQHPVNDRKIHIDFMIIDETTQNLRMSMPINYYNLDKSPGIKLGGFLKITSRAIEVKLSNMASLRAWLGADIAGFQQNQCIKLDDIHFPEGIKPVKDKITVGIITASKGGES